MKLKKYKTNREASTASKGVVGYDFSITGKTKNGEKLTATIPAGTPRKQIAMLFETIVPGFFYNIKS